MRFFYRIFFNGHAEATPRMRMKMVVKDNDDKKRQQEPASPAQPPSSSSSSLPPITMRIKQQDLHSNGAAVQNGKRQQADNRIKLSHIIGSSSEDGDSWGSTTSSNGRGGDGVANNINRQQINAASGDTRKSGSAADNSQSRQAE